MTAFAENVFDVFTRIRLEYGFLPASACSTNRFASLVKKVDEETFAYAFVHDNRAGGGEMVTSAWIAPPECPGDSLDMLNVGYKILIAKTCDVDDDFFHGCEQRIINLLPALVAFREVIVKELADPPLRTRRWQVYHYGREAYAAVQQIATQDPDGECSDILEVARRFCAQGKLATTLEPLQVASIPAAKSVLESGLLTEDAISHYSDDPERLTIGLVGPLYVNALVEVDIS